MRTKLTLEKERKGFCSGPKHEVMSDEPVLGRPASVRYLDCRWSLSRLSMPKSERKPSSSKSARDARRGRTRSIISFIIAVV